MLLIHATGHIDMLRTHITPEGDPWSLHWRNLLKLLILEFEALTADLILMVSTANHVNAVILRVDDLWLFKLLNLPHIFDLIVKERVLVHFISLTARIIVLNMGVIIGALLLILLRLPIVKAIKLFCSLSLQWLLLLLLLLSF